MNEKQINLLTKVVIIISILILVVSLTSLAIIQEIKTLEIQLKVANHLGFNTDTDKIYFGTIPPGNVGSREVIVENNEYKKSIVRLKIRGELERWVAVSENNFILEQGGSKIVKVTASVPKDAELKDYEGKLVITFTRF